jgi:hypothetical protein
MPATMSFGFSNIAPLELPQYEQYDPSNTSSSTELDVVINDSSASNFDSSYDLSFALNTEKGVEAIMINTYNGFNNVEATQISYSPKCHSFRL